MNKPFVTEYHDHAWSVSAEDLDTYRCTYVYADGSPCGQQTVPQGAVGITGSSRSLDLAAVRAKLGADLLTDVEEQLKLYALKFSDPEEREYRDGMRDAASAVQRIRIGKWTRL